MQFEFRGGTDPNPNDIWPRSPRFSFLRLSSKGRWVPEAELRVSEPVQLRLTPSGWKLVGCYCASTSNFRWMGLMELDANDRPPLAPLLCES